MRPENEWFQPEKLGRLYYAYAAIAAVLTLVPVALVALFAPAIWALVAGAAWLAVFGFLAWWIPAFHRTAAYRLTTEDVEYRRGVWFRKISEVPYDRITNVDTGQGPVQRWVGVGQISLHTAGYASQTGAELTVDGVADYEAVKEQVLGKVRQRPPAATESGAGRTAPGPGEHVPKAVEPGEGAASEAALLAEVRAIRELLEGQSGA